MPKIRIKLYKNKYQFNIVMKSNPVFRSNQYQYMINDPISASAVAHNITKIADVKT